MAKKYAAEYPAFNETYNIDEVGDMLKNQKHNLEMNTYATISGIRGKQFGKEIFSTVIKFKDLRDFMETFKDVQRNLIVSKMNSAKNYILSGLGKKNPMRFFPAITATARGNIFYSEEDNRLAIDTRTSKLSLNDGQHRYFATIEAIRTLQGRINNSKDEVEKENLKELLKELNNMAMPVVIFNNLTIEEERQLFSDTNNLAQRPSRSATIRLNQTDLFSRMSRDLVNLNKYFQHYGVEMDKASIYGKDNKNTILLTTIYASIKTLLGRKLDEETYEVSKKYLNDTFNNMYQMLPPDLNNRGIYITDQSYAIKGIVKFIADYRAKDFNDKVIFETIGKVNWVADINYWKQYGAMTSKQGKLVFGGSGDHGRYAVFHALEDNLPDQPKQLELIQ
jgi:DNA sulfur modification protein DndB